MPARPHGLILIAILIVAIALRVPGLLEPSLWFDEVYGATFATLGPIDSVIAALRFDIHPPLYYLQLSVWGWFGDSDAWLYANSLVFSLGAIVVLYLAASRFFDGRVGAIAAGLMALSPPDLLYAQSVRMYSMVIFLSIVCWVCNHRLAHGASGWRFNLSLIGAALTLTYSHALGFFMAAFFGMYCLFEMRRVRLGTGETTSKSSPILRWCWMYALAGVAMLPAVGNALVRSTAHATKPDFTRILSDMTFFVVGSEGIGTHVGHGLAVAATVALAVIALRVPRSRPTILGVIVAPCAVMLIASYLMDPMWNRRSLAFVQPFIGLALSIGIVAYADRATASASGERGAADPALGSPPSWRRLVLPAGAVAVCFGAFAALHIGRSEKEQDFRAAAAAIRSELPDGGTVFVPQFVDFWAINRYLVGPGWGSPLVVQANERSERWDKIIAKLGEERADQLGLIGETTQVQGERYHVVIGPRFDPDDIEIGPVLLVHSDELPEEDEARLTMFEAVHLSNKVPGLEFGRLRADSPR